jgi:hypothetical protein
MRALLCGILVGLLLPAVASAHTDAGFVAPFEWPADGTITSPFGIDGYRWHSGLDIGTLQSLTVRAAAPGRVPRVRGLRRRRHRRPRGPPDGTVRPPGFGQRPRGAVRLGRPGAGDRRLHRLVHRNAPPFRVAIPRPGVRSVPVDGSALASSHRRGGYNRPNPGRLAQLGEHQLDKLGVTGSSPVPPIS